MADPRLRELSIAHHPLVHVASAFSQQPCQKLITLDFPPQRREERNTTVVAACHHLRSESQESEKEPAQCSCTGFGAGPNRMSRRAWVGVQSAQRWVSRWWSRLSQYYASWCGTSG